MLINVLIHTSGTQLITTLKDDFTFFSQQSCTGNAVCQRGGGEGWVINESILVLLGIMVGLKGKWKDFMKTYFYYQPKMSFLPKHCKELIATCDRDRTLVAAEDVPWVLGMQGSARGQEVRGVCRMAPWLRVREQTVYVQ